MRLRYLSKSVTKNHRALKVTKLNAKKPTHLRDTWYWHDKMHYTIVALFASIFRDHFHLSKRKYKIIDTEILWGGISYNNKMLLQKYLIQKYVIQKYDYKTFFSIPDWTNSFVLKSISHIFDDYMSIFNLLYNKKRNG